MCPAPSRADTGSLWAARAQDDARFSELVENVGVTVRYFNEHVEAARAAGGWDWSVEKVLEVIQGARSGRNLGFRAQGPFFLPLREWEPWAGQRLPRVLHALPAGIGQPATQRCSQGQAMQRSVCVA